MNLFISVFLIDLVELGLLLINLHLQFVNYVQQVVLHYVEFKSIILVFEFLLHALDVQLCLEETALCAMVGDVLEELFVGVAEVEESQV